MVVHPSPTWDGTLPPPEPTLVPRVSPSRLRRALDGDAVEGFRDEVTVVDVGSHAAYGQAHIPGALHLAGHELADRAEELDSTHTIVLYDLSPDERLGAEAALVLYALGFTDVAVLEGGIQQWYAAGYGIEGTWLTPTPEPGPPWTLTPLMPGSEVTATVAPTATAVLSGTAVPTTTVALTVTAALTATAELTLTVAPTATASN
jgi:rhodanese-related sulfurtransferase